MKPPYQKQKKANDAGFTLIELMVVIAIIGLLASVVVINVLPSQDLARVEKARGDLANLEKALLLYRLQLLDFPSSRDGLQALRTAPQSLKNPDAYPKGGYIQNLPKDPWGNDYYYRYPGEHRDFDLASWGADGEPGGEGLNSDINNWSDE